MPLSPLKMWLISRRGEARNTFAEAVHGEHRHQHGRGQNKRRPHSPLYETGEAE